MEKKFLTEMRQILPEEHIYEKEPMKKHTTFKIGGPSDYFILVSSPDELKNGMKICHKYGVPTYVIGNGSNLLVSDRGFRGCIFAFDKKGEIQVEGTTIVADAGVLMSQIGKVACENSLTGFEFAAGIPGSIGGGIFMNAGAYGGELKDVVTEVTILTDSYEIATRKAKEMELSYRHSSLMDENAIVLSVTIQLEEGKKDEILAKMKELAQKRREKQPLEYGSAGSTFKRPQGYFAGKLIEDSGFKGYCLGGAQVSEKHCGFVINKDNASAQDVYQLTKRIQQEVYQKFHVRLEREIRLVGDFSENNG